MSGIPAKVWHDGTDWAVDPPTITLDSTNNSVDCWYLDDVYRALAPKNILAVRIEFTDGPIGKPWNSTTGPLASVPAFFKGAKKLSGCPRNLLYGTYKYDVIVTCEGELEPLWLQFPVDPQIDNVAPPGDKPGGGDPDPDDEDGGEKP
ncbi:MAG TPA: hypothetical protein VKK31_29630 [Thermoanaerobaculia bacterium]|nr:hypothetical protein [Thermoanaerobaculia bacterium]